MARTVATRTIAAPIDLVFSTVADPRQLRKAVPRMGEIELLSDRRYRQGSYIMDVVEFVPNDHVRVVTQPAGTIWDSVFAVRPGGQGTVLTLTMEGRTKRLRSMILNFMIRGMLKRTIEHDMDSIKAFCEDKQRSARQSAPV